MRAMKRWLEVAMVLCVAGCNHPSTWTEPVSGLDRIVLSVWGDGPGNVYFAGGGIGSGVLALAMRFDGSAFVDLKAPGKATLWWVFGLGPNDVWFAGEQGTILHWDGATFTPSVSGTTETLYGLWGTSASDLWAVGGTVGGSSVILHFDGMKWSAPALPPVAKGPWWKVWGCKSNSVFVVGDGGSIAHFDGMAWTAMDGGVPPTQALFTVSGSSCNNVFAVGGRGIGYAVHYDGTAWSPVTGFDPSNSNGLAALSVDPMGDAIFGGAEGAKVRLQAGVFTDDSALSPRDSDFHGGWLDGPDDLFLVGGNFTAPMGAPRVGVIAHYGATLPTTLR